MNHVLYAFNVSQGNVEKTFCSRDILEVGAKSVEYQGISLSWIKLAHGLEKYKQNTHDYFMSIKTLKLLYYSKYRKQFEMSLIS